MNGYERARATVRRIEALERKMIEEFYAQREAEKARFRYTAKAEKMLEEVKTLQGLPSPEFQAAFAKELGKSLSPQDRAMMEAYQKTLRKK